MTAAHSDPSPNAGPPNPDAGRSAIRRAAQSFARSLAAAALAPATTRVEAWLGGADAGRTLFALEAELAAALSAAARTPPRHEVVWASGTASGEAVLRLSAYDVAGRVLLRRSYGAARRKGAGDA